MKANYKLAAAVLAGVVIGIVGATAIHARQVKPLPAYVIAEVDVKDPKTFQTYLDQVPPTLAPFGGHYLVRAGKTWAVEGDVPMRFAVIAFDGAEKAQAWENSPAYEALKPIRHRTATSRIFIAEGIASQ